MSFARAIKRYAPGYMAGGEWMGKLLGSVGGMLDDFAERAFLGRCAGLPFAAGAKRQSDGHLLQCEPDVFPYHARDRGITLYDTEPEASKRVRLARSRQLHARRGTHRGEMEHVQPYFLGTDGRGPLPRMRIVHQDGAGDGAMWHTLEGTNGFFDPGVYTIARITPSNWEFDGQTAKWSRWWAIIYTTGTVLESGATEWDDGSDWDGGQLWDGFDIRDADDIFAMLREWSAAHSRCAGLILTRDNDSFDPYSTAVTDPAGWTSLPVGNWGSSVDPVTGAPTRPPYATFLYLRP